jgi:hypothetical protein
MLHMILRINNKISKHLDTLGMLKMNMLLITHRVREMLVNQFTDNSPGLAVLQREEMVIFANEMLYNV